MFRSSRPLQIWCTYKYCAVLCLHHDVVYTYPVFGQKSARSYSFCYRTVQAQNRLSGKHKLSLCSIMSVKPNGPVPARRVLLLFCLTYRAAQVYAPQSVWAYDCERARQIAATQTVLCLQENHDTRVLNMRTVPASCRNGRRGMRSVKDATQIFNPRNTDCKL